MASTGLLHVPADAQTAICAACLNDTTIDVYSLRREQASESDRADASLISMSRSQELDIALAPKVGPLERYVGISDNIRVTLVSEWDVYGASNTTLAKWNVKVRFQACDSSVCDQPPHNSASRDAPEWGTHLVGDINLQVRGAH